MAGIEVELGSGVKEKKKVEFYDINGNCPWYNDGECLGNSHYVDCDHDSVYVDCNEPSCPIFYWIQVLANV